MRDIGLGLGIQGTLVTPKAGRGSKIINEKEKEKEERGKENAMWSSYLIYTARDDRGLYAPKNPVIPHESPFGLPQIGGSVHDQWGGGHDKDPPGKSRRSIRADAQRIVATRLLYPVHDPTVQPSRMQGLSSGDYHGLSSGRTGSNRGSFR